VYLLLSLREKQKRRQRRQTEKKWKAADGKGDGRPTKQSIDVTRHQKESLEKVERLFLSLSLLSSLFVIEAFEKAAILNTNTIRVFSPLPSSLFKKGNHLKKKENRKVQSDFDV